MQVRPIVVEREKFMVARVERKRPRRRSEKHLVKVYSWVVKGVKLVGINFAAAIVAATEATVMQWRT